ncbi:MAG: RNA polymerase sigma factor [Phycisphaerae bacterium]|nr:RNA polymerase sigma factor [Phycisphaerae bacterium]
MTKPTDAELLRDHLAGDPGAFETLTNRYLDELFGFVLRFVNNGAIAEDLVQEAFIQVHLSADSFDPKRAFKPWLYTIAANKARDFLRARGRRPAKSLDATWPGDDGPSAAEHLEAGGVSVSDELESDEQHQLVRRLVGEMPDNLRTILLLGYFQQLPYAEIAEILDIPVGTVKSRLHSAVAYFAGLWQSQKRSPNQEQD